MGLLDSASPSIDDLLQHLQGGMSAPGGAPSGPPPAPMSAEGVGNPGAPPPGLLGGGAAPQGMAARIMGKMPAWMQAAKDGGLVSDEDIQNSKPGFLSRIFDHPLSYGQDDRWGNNLDKVMQMHQLATQVGQNRNVLAARQNMVNLFPQKEGETAEEMDNRLESMYGYAVQHGDLEMAKNIGDVVKETAKRPKELAPPKPLEYSGIISDGSFNPAFKGKTVKQLQDPYTHKIIAEMPEGALPMSEDAKTYRDIAQRSLDQSRDTAAAQRTDALDNGQARNFVAQNKSLTDKSQKYSTFLNNLDQVRHGNVAAVEALKYAMVNNTDVNAQMRQGILQKLEQIEPSIAGKTGMAASLALKGALPEKDIANMENLVKSGHKADKALYQQHWDYATKVNPRLANHPDITPPEIAFDIPGEAGAAVNSGVAKVKGFLPNRK